MPEIVVTKRIRIKKKEREIKKKKRKKTENYVGTVPRSSEYLLKRFSSLRIGRKQRLPDTSIFYMVYVKGIEPVF